MSTLEINGKEYTIHKLPVKASLNIGRRILPLLAALMGSTDSEALQLAVKEFAGMSDEQSDYCIFGLLSCIKRKEGGVLANIVEAGDLMFQELGAMDVIRLAVEAAKENFGDFLLSNALTSAVKA